MIAPVRHAYVQRVAGSRVATGARNVAKTSKIPDIETSTPSKRTGAQEESLLHEGAETIDGAPADRDRAAAAGRRSQAGDDAVATSFAWTERVKAATRAYHYVTDKIDETDYRIKPGDIYDEPS